MRKNLREEIKYDVIWHAYEQYYVEDIVINNMSFQVKYLVNHKLKSNVFDQIGDLIKFEVEERILLGSR